MPAGDLCPECPNRSSGRDRPDSGGSGQPVVSCPNPHRKPPACNVMRVSFRISPCTDGRRIADADARRVQVTRRLTAARLRYCGLAELIDGATLIVSELVTNAIVHSGGTQITVTLAVCDGSLYISVHDEMPGSPKAHTTSDEAECGRGLLLVDCLAGAHGGTWGTSDEGATTWCRLALPKDQP